MTDATMDATTVETVSEGEPRVPWWNIESPLRRRIKGRYVRRAAIAAAALNVVLLTGMADADSGTSATLPEGLRPSLALPAPDPLARMAALAP